MKLRRILALMVCLALVGMAVSLTGCSSKPGQEKPAPSGGAQQKPAEKPAATGGGKQLIQICGATSGGTYFLLANAVAQLLNEKLPNVNASAQSTPGTPKILELIVKGEAEFGVGQAGVAQDAFDGKGQFQGRAMKNFRSVTYLYPNVMQIVARKGSGVKKVEDFKGKSFCVGAAGSATELNAYDLFTTVLGYDYRNKKDMIAQYTSEAQSVELLKNRQADGANMIASLGSASMLELMSSGDFELINVSDDIINRLKAINPAYYKFVIPANTYANQPEPVQTFAVANWFYCRADLPEDLVYNVVKTIYENRDYLIKAHKVAENIKPENALLGMTVELHPGAAKYFREIGALK